jgi:large subunit ribosomal protein L23
MPRITLLKPLLTEKTMLLAQKQGQFTFLVEKTATKDAVAQSVEDQFKVNVLKVTSGAVKGKTKRTGKRRLPQLGQDRKKMTVTLKAGQMIEYFKLPEEKKSKKEKKS